MYIMVNINDYITKIKIQKTPHTVKLNNSKIKMMSFLFKKEMNHKTAVNFLDKFIRHSKDLKGMMFQISFIYDGVLFYNITKGFITLPKNKHLNQMTLRVIDEYGNEIFDRVEDLITGFDIFYTRATSKKGGNDINKMNDCLYYALKNTVREKTFNRTPCMVGPSALKKQLNLKRNDKIHIKHIPIVEKLLKVNIVVSGDHEYIPKDTYTSKVYIELVNGHYRGLNKQKNKLFLFDGIYDEPKPLQVFKKYKDTYKFYNGDKIYKSDKFDKSYISIQAEPDMTLYDTYEITKKEYDDMIELSNGKYNPYKFKNIPKMGLYYFYKEFKDVEPDNITHEEASILQKATKGGLRYARPGKYGKVYDYDFNRFYPYLQSTGLDVPIRKPVFQKLDELPKFIKLGIYKANIHFEKPHPLFMENQFNLYTNFDLVMFKNMGATIELLDEEWNAMIYDKCVRMCRLKNFYEELYELSKKSKFKLFKKLMNSLWGKLCSKKTKLINNSEEEIEMNAWDLIQRSDVSSNIYEVKKIDKDKIFQYDYARMLPFILSKGRRFLYMRIKDNLENVIYVHTDGFITSKKIEYDSDKSKEFGWFKMKEYSAAVIKNKNKKDLIK